MSSSALLSQTGSGFSAALWSRHSAAIVGSGLLRVSGTGTAFPGDSLSLCVYFSDFIWNSNPSNLALQADRVSARVPSPGWGGVGWGGYLFSRRRASVQVLRPPLILKKKYCWPQSEQPFGTPNSLWTCFPLLLQATDGRCHCTIGYQPSKNGDVCVHKVYDVCRDGKTRTQYGNCLDRYQWLLHCREQVRPCTLTWYTHAHTHTQMPAAK